MFTMMMNYGKLRTFISLVTLFTMVTVVKQWVYPWDPLLHKYGCHTTMVGLQCLLNLTLHAPTLTAASFAATSEVWTSAILGWLNLRD
jgi:hypothetical protein